MVMIQPPVPGGDADASAGQSGARPNPGSPHSVARHLPAAAALERSFDRINDLLADPDHAAPAPPETAPPDGALTSESMAESQEDFSAAAGTEPLAPASDWASSHVRAYRSWLMWGMIGVVSAGTVAGGVMQYLGSRENQSVAVAAPAADASTTEPDSSPSTAPATLDPNPPTPTDLPQPESPNSVAAAANLLADDNNNDNNNTAVSLPEADAAPAAEPLHEAAPDAENPDAENPDEASPDEAPLSDAAELESPESADGNGHAHAPQLDQQATVDIDNNSSLPSQDKEPKSVASGSVPDAFVAPRRGEAVRDLFREMANISSDEEQPEQMPSSTMDSAEATGEDAPVSILNEEPGYVLPSDRDRPPVRQHHLASRMNDPVAQIQLVNQPLRDFLIFFTEFTTIPVTIPADVLLQNQLSAQQTVSVKSKGLTAAQLLTEALQPLNVTPDTSSGHLVLRTHSDADQGLRAADYSVDSLLGGTDDKASRRLADECLRLTGASNWSFYGGPCELKVMGTTWKVQATESVHFHMTYVLDSLRHARNLPRQADYPERWYSRQSRSRRAQPLLQTPITMRSIRWSPLYQVVDELARRADCELFVDWEALAAAGWPHDVPVSVNIENQPLADGLSKMLRPLSLVYRVVDDRTLQVTTREAEARQFDVETYDLTDRLNQGRTTAQIQQDILQLVGLSEFHAGGGYGHLYIDPAGKVAVVRLPQSYQLVVDRYLSAP
jgi:hypothetical protein